MGMQGMILIRLLLMIESYQKLRGLSADGYAGYDTHTAIIND